MLRMVKAELYKLFKSGTFKVLIIISLVSIIQCIYHILLEKNVTFVSEGGVIEVPFKEDDRRVIPGQLGVIKTDAEDVDDIKSYETFNISFGIGVIEILIAILVGRSVAKEYSEGTIKNTLAYGQKRSHFYLSKYVANIIVIAILIGIITIGSTVALTIIKGWGKPFEISQLLKMINTFIGAMIIYGGVLAVFMLIAILIKNNGGTIVIAILGFVLFPTQIAFSYGQNEVFDKIYESTLFYNSLLVTHIKATNVDIIKASWTGMIWLIVSLLLGIKIFERQKIK